MCMFLQVCVCVSGHVNCQSELASPPDLYPLRHSGRSASPLNLKDGLFTNGEGERERGRREYVHGVGRSRLQNNSVFASYTFDNIRTQNEQNVKLKVNLRGIWKNHKFFALLLIS